MESLNIGKKAGKTISRARQYRDHSLNSSYGGLHGVSQNCAYLQSVMDCGSLEPFTPSYWTYE